VSLSFQRRLVDPCPLGHQRDLQLVVSDLAEQVERRLAHGVAHDG
jgi:hypothetical protein